MNMGLMRQRMKPPRIQEVVVESTPAPVKGWNTRDGLFNMKPEYAVKLENYLPNSDSVDLRGGSLRHAQNVGQITAFTRASIATYVDADDALQTAAVDELRFTYYDGGGGPDSTLPLIEAAATNRVLHNRDMTNAAWTQTNITVTRDQTGRDGAANSACLLDCTTANGKVSQAITSTNRARVFSVWVKRAVSGATSYGLSLDNTNFTTFSLNNDGWRRHSITTTSANPTIAIRVNSTIRPIIVDLVQEEDGATATSAIETAGSTGSRAADTPTYSSGSDSDTINASVETLMAYSSGATTRLLAAAANSIYNVTTEGAIGTPIVTGMTNNRWSYVNFKSVLVMVNGADTPRTYNGSTTSTTSITGVTSLSYVAAHKNRLWFIEKNTLKAAYLATDAISGGATYFDLTNFFKFGGRLVALGTWTRDGGDGMDDLWVAITNKGEVAIYQGTDPSSANTWSLVGIFRIAAPVGDRPLLRMGSDLVVISEDGYVPLSAVISLDRTGATSKAISDAIRPTVSAAVRMNGTKFGWQGIQYPRGNYALFNIPTTEGSAAEQHVVNTITGAWCKFTGWDAVCWEIYNEEIYFGTSNGLVMKADNSNRSDDNKGYAGSQGLNAITGDIQPAFNYFGKRSQLKHFTMVRPIFSSDGNPEIALALNVDFEERNPQTITTAQTSASEWDSAVWDVSLWGGAEIIRKGWQTVTGYGYCAGLRLRTSTYLMAISLNSIDYVYKRGGIM